jgi:hypothetical protein
MATDFTDFTDGRKGEIRNPFRHFLISFAINHPVPGAWVFDSEESRKPGNETGNVNLYAMGPKAP